MIQMISVEETFRWIAAQAALLLEAFVVLTVCAGAMEAGVRTLGYLLNRGRPDRGRRAIWVSFARWLMLALEFALGADLVRTAIAPTWDQVGQLAAIAAIRTGLGYFLERDMDAAREAQD